ncbi:MAG: ChaN family lipoprotein [Flavobacteriales bacterium]|nr:ChaN family lipoprotein [Flavobacteriales bacterium]
MKTAVISLLTTLSFLNGAHAQDHAFQLFDSNGKKVKYAKMIKHLDGAQIILFGEFHDNPISHWLQLEVTSSLLKNNQLVLGAEMFEADNQKELNQYLSGEINTNGLDTLARLWTNFKTDYKPLLDLAKENKLDFVAANVPRSFAKLVYKGGFEALDTLSKEEKSWIAPLPIAYDPTLPGYVEMLEMMGGHGGENLPKAQAIKDATMAHFILANYQPEQTFIHYNGAYHSNNYEGILWYLKQTRPELKYATISTVSQADISKLEAENKGIADFIICVDEDMTSTH